ncbi:hypothetical protein NQD34_017446 [Periophthalmus magnuspinnatus]|nr:hypothetical protein NQD34_017446 [Periophthalmus magnuspinnatus]
MFIPGVAMETVLETALGLRLLLHPFDPLTSKKKKKITREGAVQGEGSVHIFAQSIQKTDSCFQGNCSQSVGFVVAVRERKRKREREKEAERERNDWQRFVFTPPSFYTLCCQCLTGSWLSRPSAFFHFKGTRRVSVYVTPMPNDFSAFGYGPVFRSVFPPLRDARVPGG